MKKTVKKALSMLLSFIMVITMIQGSMLFTSAKLVGPDQKTELTITTDKSRYSWGDTILINIEVKNVTDEVLTGIRINSFARNYLKVVQQGDLPVIGLLAPGETKTVQIEYYATKLVGFMAFFFPIIWLFGPAARIAYRESAINYEQKIKVGAFNYRIGFDVEYDVEIDPDDATDPIDTEVTDKDSYVLTCSEKEIPVKTNTPVLFYVNSTVTVTSFELICKGVSTGIQLFDDGDYLSNGDDVPNDGCYTGLYYVNKSVEDDYDFTATATVGDDKITTNICSIFIYSEITDEQTMFINSVEDGLTDVLKSVREKNTTVSEEVLIAKLKKASEDYLASYVATGDISQPVYSNGNYSFKWDYVYIGVDTTYIIYEKKTDIEIKQREQLKSATISAQAAINTGDIYSKGKVVVLNYYPENHSWSRSYDNIAKLLSDAGFTVTNVYDFTCYDFKDLQEYNSLILLDSHGNTDDGKQTGTPCICTEEAQSKEKNKSYSADIKKNRIDKVTLDTGEKVYWVRAEFFDFYYSEDKLNSPIVNLGCCRNYPTGNNKMVKAWRDAGASAVCGYSASVGVPYDNDMAKTLVEELLKGKTVSNALSIAKSTIAQEDNSYIDIDPEWNKRAVLNLYGDANASLYHKLLNGNYDNSSVLSVLGIIPSWEKYGDARTVYKLAGIKPMSSPKMAFISSGFGSKNDQTTSCVYQTILVPENAKTLSFKYDVVSEEPMEFVGSEYDDIFQVDILNTNGDVLETLVYESVNTSNWYAIDGINFPNGDETTYHTRWINYSRDTIQNYQDQLIVLRFSVRDSGDSVYDTAALIDSVKIS